MRYRRKFFTVYSFEVENDRYQPTLNILSKMYNFRYHRLKTSIYDKQDDFDLDIVNFPFLDGDVPRLTSFGVYISQLIRLARVSSHVDDFDSQTSQTRIYNINNFVGRFQNFIAGILTQCLNIMSD